MRPEERWQDPAVARAYEVRRFEGSRLARWKHRRDVWLVLRLLAVHAATRARVLDLPAGTGRLLPPLVGAGFRPVGVDVALAMLRAEGRAALPPAAPGRLLGLVQAEATHLPFAAGTFDAALSLRFFFHLEGRSERIAVLRELARTTRGPILAQVRYRWTLKQLGRYLRSRFGSPGRYRRSQSREALVSELAEAGLELVALRPVSRLFSDKALLVARPPISPLPL